MMYYLAFIATSRFSCTVRLLSLSTIATNPFSKRPRRFQRHGFRDGNPALGNLGDLVLWEGESGANAIGFRCSPCPNFVRHDKTAQEDSPPEWPGLPVRSVYLHGSPPPYEAKAELCTIRSRWRWLMQNTLYPAGQRKLRTCSAR
jgi:hypothetical protein